MTKDESVDSGHEAVVIELDRLRSVFKPESAPVMDTRRLEFTLRSMIYLPELEK